MDQQVEEKKRGILNIGENMRHNKDIVLERKGKGDRLGETESRIDEVVSCNIGVASWLVEEKEIEVLNVEKSI